MIITPDQFTQITGNKDHSWVPILNEFLPLNGITTPLQVAHFLAQCSHESGGFTILKENLNYSQQGLRKVFPKYFPDDNIAFKYARQPAAIANRVYAGRMGNGAEGSGDGWKYSGKGAIQLTGKDNVTKCSQYIFGDNRLVDDPSYLATKEGAVRSACWFWKTNNCNQFADNDDVVGLTKKINGGKIGLDHRIELTHKAKSVLGVF